MTSALSREDIEAEIWHLLGGHRVDTWKVRRVLRLIDQYAATRNYVPEPEEEPVLLECLLCHGEFPVSHFFRRASTERGYGTKCRECRKPGMRKCAACKVKKAIGQFPVKRDGFRSRKCAECVTVGKPEYPPLADYLCRSCRVRKPLELFPEAKRQTRSLMIPCMACSQGKLEIAS